MRLINGCYNLPNDELTRHALYILDNLEELGERVAEQQTPEQLEIVFRDGRDPTLLQARYIAIGLIPRPEP